MIQREELWNGSRERPRSLVSRDPNDNIILWAWTEHGPCQRQYSAMSVDPAHSGLGWVRIVSARQQRDWPVALS